VRQKLQKVHFVGIVGMGGIGKTTSAHEISRIVSNEYDAYHFLGDVRS
jgi:ABC-type glutathione transport system ATPase component